MSRIDFDEQYEMAAEFFARVYGNALTLRGCFWGQQIVSLYPEIIEMIEIDPSAWESRVSDYAYAMAMEGVDP